MKKKRKNFDVLIYQMEVDGKTQTLIEANSFINWIKDNNDADKNTQDILNEFASGLEAQIILATSLTSELEKMQ